MRGVVNGASWPASASRVLFPAQCAACDAAGAGCARACRRCEPASCAFPTLRVNALGALRGRAARRRSRAQGWPARRRRGARAFGSRRIRPRGALLVPVPTTSARRLRERGIDGVRAIAAEIAAREPATCVAAALVQHSAMRRSRGDRGASVCTRAGAFGATRVPHATGEIVLVDDVCTTGATLGGLRGDVARRRLCASQGHSS